MVPEKYREFITTLKALVEANEVPMTRIDDAVTRILRVKAAMGLLAPGWTVRVDPELETGFGSDEHRRVARQAVARVARAAQERRRQAAPRRRQAHPRRRPQRRRSRRPVGWLDDHLAGPARAGHHRHDHSRSDPPRCRTEHAGDVCRRRLRRGRRRRRDRGRWRRSVCRVPGRPRDLALAEADQKAIAAVQRGRRAGCHGR